MALDRVRLDGRCLPHGHLKSLLLWDRFRTTSNYQYLLLLPCMGPVAQVACAQQQLPP